MSDIYFPQKPITLYVDKDNSPNQEKRYLGFDCQQNRAVITHSKEDFNKSSNDNTVIFELDGDSGIKSMSVLEQSKFRNYIFFRDSENTVAIDEISPPPIAPGEVIHYLPTPFSQLQQGLRNSLSLLVNPEVDMLDGYNVQYFKMLKKAVFECRQYGFYDIDTPLDMVMMKTIRQFRDMNETQRTKWEERQKQGGFDKYQLIEKTQEGLFVIYDHDSATTRHVITDNGLKYQTFDQATKTWNERVNAQSSVPKPNVQKGIS